MSEVGLPLSMLIWWHRLAKRHLYSSPRCQAH